MRRVSLILIVAALVMDCGRIYGDSRPDTLEGSGDGHRRSSEDRLWKRRNSIRELEAAALRSPRDPEILRRLAQAYLDAGFQHLARRTFERLLRQVPEDPDAHFGLGRICER